MITINNKLDTVFSCNLDHKILTLKPGNNVIETVGTEGFNEIFVKNLVKNVPVLEIVETVPVAPVEGSLVPLPNTGEKNYVDQDELRKQLESINLPDVFTVKTKGEGIIEITGDGEDDVKFTETSFNHEIVKVTKPTDPEYKVDLEKALALKDFTESFKTQPASNDKLKALLKTPTKPVAKANTKTVAKKK